MARYQPGTITARPRYRIGPTGTVRLAGVLATNLATVPRVSAWASASNGGIGVSNAYYTSGFTYTLHSEPDPDDPACTLYYARKQVTAATTPGITFGSLADAHNPPAGAARAIPVAAGSTLTCSYRARVSVAANPTANLQIVLWQYDANRANAPTLTVPVMTVPSADGQWHRVTAQIALDPAVAFAAPLWELAELSATGDWLDVADILITPGHWTGGYFDGDTHLARWTGTPNASTSQLIGALG